MNSLPQIFNFNAAQLRVIIQATGEPLFCASDVTNALGYANGRDAVGKHCRPNGVAKCDTPTPGGVQELTFISEPNLYRLTLKSHAPHAETFQDWVTEQVLPQIRKTGTYSPQASTPAIPSLEDSLRGWLLAVEENKKKDMLLLAAHEAKELAQQQAQLLATEAQESKPKVDFYHAVTASKEMFDMEEVAKMLASEFRGLGRNKLIDFLRQQGIFEKKGASGTPLPYQTYVAADLFFIKVSEFNNPHTQRKAITKKTYATVKGLKYIRKKLTASWF